VLERALRVLLGFLDEAGERAEGGVGGVICDGTSEAASARCGPGRLATRCAGGLVAGEGGQRGADVVTRAMWGERRVGKAELLGAAASP